MTRFHNELVSGVDAALLLTNHEGTVLMANEQASCLLGRDLTGASLAGEQIDADHPILASLADLYRRASGRSETLREVVIGDNGGGPRLLRLSVSPGGESCATGRIVAIIDITDALEESDAVQRILSRVSHDIRSPLTSISGAAELLLSGRVGSPDGVQSRLLSIVLDGVQRVEAILKKTKGEVARQQAAAGAGDGRDAG